MPIGQANRLMPSLRRVVLARQSAARTDGELLGAFVNERDADAFAELVRRHGRMVLGVCRRVVGDHATADDAFQATFLVLARRAVAVRPREQVGSWLYGVAYRTALKARMVLARRRSREKQVDVMPEPTAPTSSTAVWADLQPVIDEELARLPDKFRLPVVLCDLEGRPQREVAKHLNVPPATLATRLASARRTLAARLTRRGITLSGGALAGLLGSHAAAFAVPPALAGGVVRAVEAGATGTAVNSLVSAHAVQLSEGVMRMMMLAKLKSVAVMAATALVLTTGLGLGMLPAAAGDDPAPGEKTTARPAAPDDAAAARPRDRGQPEPADDATFLRRLCMDVRGTPPTDVETWFFVSDPDDDKRAKVVEWITDDEGVKVVVAKKLGVPPERVKVVRAKLSADGKFVELTLDGSTERLVRPIELAFTPDGKTLLSRLKTDTTGEKQLLVVGDKDTVWTTELGIPVKGFADAQKFALLQRTQLAEVGNEKLGGDKPRYRMVGGKDVLWAWVADDGKQPTDKPVIEYSVRVTDSDAEFLKRALTDTRGSGPTALELKYFTEDKDPKKREKLLDTLLKDPTVQKKMLAVKPVVLTDTKAGLLQLYLQTDGLAKPVPAPPVPPVPPGDKLEKLVDALIATNKSDEAILESLTLATLSRLPTESEKKLALAVAGKVADRKAAWLKVARALAGADEARKPDIKLKVKVEPINPPVPPVPPTPPKPPKPKS